MQKLMNRNLIQSCNGTQNKMKLEDMLLKALICEAEWPLVYFFCFVSSCNVKSSVEHIGKVKIPDVCVYLIA